MGKKTFVLILLALWQVNPAEAKLKRSHLNLAEVQQAAQSVGDAEFKKMDKDGDGTISKQEYMEKILEETITKYEKAFNQIDQDNDGKISKEEYENFMNFATGSINQLMRMMQK